MKWKLPLTIIVVVIIYYNRTVESKIQGFPVPARAEYVYQDEHKDYEYNASCFSNGLPFDYQLGIWFAGWKTLKADGAMIKYKKDDRVVVLVQSGNAIYIYKEGKTQ